MKIDGKSIKLKRALNTTDNKTSTAITKYEALSVFKRFLRPSNFHIRLFQKLLKLYINMDFIIVVQRDCHEDFVLKLDVDC